ncbi:MAG: DUF1800 family protein [Parvularculaceae bacterium]
MEKSGTNAACGDAPNVRAMGFNQLFAKTASALALVAAAACAPADDNGAGLDPSNPGAGLTSTVSDVPTPNEASRFLTQASFGPSAADIDQLTSTGMSEWIEDQAAAAPSFYLPRLVARELAGDELDDDAASDIFWENAVNARDQLRQRVAFALSQIVVVSESSGSPVNDNPRMLAYYMDILSRGALGNYRDILEEVTYSPAMAEYLTYMRNRKADPDSGRVPDENYAREILQLFTIGLVDLLPNGEPDPAGGETYDNEDVVGLAKVFTGLALSGGFRERDADDDAEFSRLVAYPEEHSTEEKSFLGLTIPANTGPEASITMALDHIFAHPNVGPFVCRQLIQRLVKSDPSPAYVQRVAETFDRGSFTLLDGDVVGDGRRGDMTATVAAILLDEEARQDPGLGTDVDGKVREPVLRFLHWARAFNVASAVAAEDRFLGDMGRPDRLSQHPFRSPSVFNFYRPRYIAPSSETGAAGVTAPELQLVNETSAIGYVNIMGRYIRDDTPTQNDGDGSAFRPNYEAEIALADDPAALVERLDLLMTSGLMNQQTKDRIITVLNEVEIRDDRADEDRETRVHLAVLMAVTAPSYLVTR